MDSSSPTILIVDDHPSFRRCAQVLLEEDGFAVVGEAEDGAEALQAIDSSIRTSCCSTCSFPTWTASPSSSVSGREAAGRPRLEPRGVRLRTASSVRAARAASSRKAELTGAAVRFLLR
jgi:DNA-binding NarL/FixJ family response regulator